MTTYEMRKWITKRYGKLAIQKHSVMFSGQISCLVSVVTASVPVMGGVSVGAGATKEIAIAALHGDLTGDYKRLAANASQL